MSIPPVSSPEFEVLPPASKSVPPGQDAAAKLIAYLMDNLLQVPGTKARIGLNPFLDLIPVLGDTAAMVVSTLTIAEGFRRRVPKVVLMRMGLNILLNGVIGIIPGVGEAFAFWYRPTSRNYQLLQEHAATAGTPRAGTWREWGFIIGLSLLVLMILGGFFALGILVTFKLYHLLFG